VFITKLAVRVDPFRRNAMAFPEGTGSGFVWDASGHVVTNYHVIAGADAARVTLGDASVWDASLVGAYPEKDIAVLRIRAPADQLRPLPVGTSADLQVGQHVFAIGNPFGLDHTLSSGVISGLGREIMSIGQRPIQGVIQTDAAINPGNSGGPLLDSAGRLIGVNTAIYSPSGASAGVGFAVPVDTVRRVVTQLVTTGRVERAGLGVIEGSGAAQAGLIPSRRDPTTGSLILGDVIVAIDAEPVADSLDLYRILDRREVNDVVQVTVIREGQRLELPVRLGAIVD
jgi:S1-C subfamily serine protease